MTGPPELLTDERCRKLERMLSDPTICVWIGESDARRDAMAMLNTIRVQREEIDRKDAERDLGQRWIIKWLKSRNLWTDRVRTEWGLDEAELVRCKYQAPPQDTVGE